MPRRGYLDWTRGLAVVVMIEWHVVDAWTRTSARDGTLMDVLAFIGGWAAPLFLLLAGVAVALAGQARMAKGLSRRAAGWSIEKRGWQVFALAHLFRLQSMVLAANVTLSGLFKPDVLNILGLGIVVAAWIWARAPARGAAVAWLVALAALIVVLTPASRLWWWPTLLPTRLEAYIRPVPHFGVFQIFPSLAYVLVGAVVGAIITAPRDARREARFHAWLAAAGVALVGAGWVGTSLPPLASTSEFWTTSISGFVMRIGMMTIVIAVAWLWSRRPTVGHWSPFVLFGRTSLFVYWIHVELAYGVFSSPLHHSLSLPQALVAFALMTGAMLAAAALWTRRGRWREAVPPSFLNPRFPLRRSSVVVLWRRIRWPTGGRPPTRIGR